MKKTSAILLVAASMLIAAPVYADNALPKQKAKTEKKAKKVMETVSFTTNMTCHKCQQKLSENLAFEKGVKGLDVNLEKQTITFTYDPAKTTPEKLAAAIKKLGYKAE